MRRFKDCDFRNQLYIKTFSYSQNLTQFEAITRVNN